MAEFASSLRPVAVGGSSPRDDRPRPLPVKLRLTEAWEEAGLVGTRDSEPVGSFLLYEKYSRIHHVTVFLNVTVAADDWPERDVRNAASGRQSPEMLSIEIDEPGLKDIIESAAC